MSDYPGFPPGVGPGIPSRGFVKGPVNSDERAHDERCDGDKETHGSGIMPRAKIRQEIPGWGAGGMPPVEKKANSKETKK